jgi:hypothetical protein
MLSRIIKVFIFLALFLSIGAYAEELTASVEFSGADKVKLTDSELLTYQTLTDFTITSHSPICAIYIEYNSAPSPATVNGKRIAENGFLHEFIELDGDLTAEFHYENADICNIRVFGEGKIPTDIERWQPIPEGVDLLLFATHSDDDQLFFAGLLPLYASREGVEVAVAYFINHYDTYNRTHELLRGLWHCGIKYYPEISPFPDGYSESIEGALSYLRSQGVEEADITAFHERLLDKYKPLVVVLHDINGEYGHGAHMLATDSFLKVADSRDSSVEKIYIHLYEENPIVLDIDSPSDALDGKTPFQVSQEAFGYHLSQHWTWFYSWIYGKSVPITSSSQIRSYNPAFYGLYKTSVGADLVGGDMLENIVTYAERKALEQPPVIEEPMPVIPQTSEPTVADAEEKSYPKLILPLLLILSAVILIFALRRKKK